jgi:hypothetical protein
MALFADAAVLLRALVLLEKPRRACLCLKRPNVNCNSICPWTFPMKLSSKT